MNDTSFMTDHHGLGHAVELLAADHRNQPVAPLPEIMPEVGLGEIPTLDVLAPLVLGGAARLSASDSFAHMDPPTPWITWALTLWNASLNQNLLHPGTAPVARDIEEKVIKWFAPFFGMQGGHMTPGSTIANLTALWAARECAHVTEVAASEGAHLSIAKSAHILGLGYRVLPSSPSGALESDASVGDLSRTVLVLTAGTTNTGAVDSLQLTGRAAWTHIDAAWAGPLRLSPHCSARLEGIERADSVSVSAHKWLFQPKESAFVLFRDVNTAHAAIRFGGAYLASANVGVLGSHGAVATPLLAMVFAWGRIGVAERIDRCMSIAQDFAAFVEADERLELFMTPETGITVWRPRPPLSVEDFYKRLPLGSTSLTTLGGDRWLRNVAANPNFDLQSFLVTVRNAWDAG